MTPHVIDGLLTTAVSLVLFYVYSDNLTGSLRLWRSFGDARSFRAFLIAVMLWLASITFLVGAVAVYLIPSWLDASRFLGLCVRGAFLVVGVFTWVSWRRR